MAVISAAVSILAGTVIAKAASVGERSNTSRNGKVFIAITSTVIVARQGDGDKVVGA
jgi:hypothetical protein